MELEDLGFSEASLAASEAADKWDEWDSKKLGTSVVCITAVIGLV